MKNLFINERLLLSRQFQNGVADNPPIASRRPRCSDFFQYICDPVMTDIGMYGFLGPSIEATSLRLSDRGTDSVVGRLVIRL